MKLVLTYLSAGQVGQSHFKPIGDPVKLMQASLNTVKKGSNGFTPLKCTKCNVKWNQWGST